MTQQDEGPIDPFDMPNRGGISEFARQEELRQERLIRVNDEMDKLTAGGRNARHLAFMRENAGNIKSQLEADTTCLTGDGNQFETSPIEYVDEAPGGSIGLPCSDNGRKDTNPKDGVGSLKPSYSAVPIPVLYELGAALTEGARKYGGYNWRVAGVRTSVYIDAARRHLDSFMEGEDIDPDSGLSHITKAIASLTVFRDAQIQGMVQNDDRPPSTQAPFMQEVTERMADIQRRYPNPVPNFTQEQVQHKRTTPVSTYGGQTLGFDIEVMLPADGAPEGFVWAQQGERRLDPDQALAVAQALRDDGYRQRVVRVMRAMQKVEQMADATEFVVGEMREPFTTVFVGDPSLTEMTEDEALEQQAEEAEIEQRDDFEQPDPFGEGRH